MLWLSVEFLHHSLFLSSSFLQTDVVDDIPTVKFAYIIWVGENMRTIPKATVSTHKGALDEVFKVSIFTYNEYERERGREEREGERKGEGGAKSDTWIGRERERES